MKRGQCGWQRVVRLRAYSVTGWEGGRASDVTGHERLPGDPEFCVDRGVGQLRVQAVYRGEELLHPVT